PGYAPTPVVAMPELADTGQVAGIAVKNEQERLGLPSFKLLGSSWALHERVKAAAGLSPDALIAFPRPLPDRARPWPTYAMHRERRESRARGRRTRGGSRLWVRRRAPRR